MISTAYTDTKICNNIISGYNTVNCSTIEDKRFLTVHVIALKAAKNCKLFLFLMLSLIIKLRLEKKRSLGYQSVLKKTLNIIF